MVGARQRTEARPEPDASRLLLVITQCLRSSRRRALVQKSQVSALLAITFSQSSIGRPKGGIANGPRI